jgi:hypothetical protein
MARNYTIAYIAGLQHCGSTLLDLLLNAHPEAVSVGELYELHDYAHQLKAKTAQTRYGSACTCGAESIWDCTFWTRIDAELQRQSGLSLKDLDINAEDPARFADHNRLFFDSLARVTGARLIVDSSKRAARLGKLLRDADLPVLAIHLLRDPKGQIHSVVKRSDGSILAPAAYYRRATLTTLRLLRGREHIRLRYEDLVANPRASLERIMPHFGLAYDPRQLDWAAAERHNLAGNRMRRTSSSDITLRDEWRQSLSRPRRALIDLLTLPATYATRNY